MITFLGRRPTGSPIPRPGHILAAARLTVLVILAATVGACTEQGGEPRNALTPTATAAADAQDGGGGVFYSYLRQPGSIDPGVAVDADDLAVVNQLFDSLTVSGPDLTLLPAAAASWEVNGPPDPADPQAPQPATVFTFHLRPDATFHDGTPVTAESFVRGWQRIVDRTSSEPSPTFYLLETVKGFEDAQAGGELSGVMAVDDHTLRVELTTPFAEFPALVAHPTLAPVPPAAVDDAEAFGRQPVGNGPFRLAEPWQPGRSRGLRLAAYEDHPDDGPIIDQLVYRIYQGDGAPAAGYDDFRNGTLDVAPIPGGRVMRAAEQFGRSDDGYTGPGVVDGIKLITAFYGFDTEKPPFDDPAVRQGLSLLIDRRAIVEEVVGEGRAVATSVVPPGIPGYEPAACAACDFDPGRAKQLLDGKVGPDRPVELVIWQAADHEDVAARVARDVNATLGEGSLTVQTLAHGAWLDAIRAGQAAFFLSGWVAEYASADTFLYSLFHQGRIGSDNLTRYKHPQVNELLDRARRELDAATRAELYQQAETIVLQDMPVAPLYFYRHQRVVGERVRGFRLDPLGEVDMTVVTLQPTG